MAATDIYEQVKCPQCGGVRYKAVTFCPHCGHREEESLLDRLREFLSGGSKSKAGAGLLSAFVSLIIAIFFLLDAIRAQSLVSLLVAMFAFAGAIRAWWTTRDQGEDSIAIELPPPRSQEEEPEAAHSETVPASKFFCENCGTEVAEDATQCPKCGMRFG
jgi:DNA-directed RNA polymerase subunit RPC12/RpoP